MTDGELNKTKEVRLCFITIFCVFLWKYVIRNLKGVDGHYNTHHDYLPIVDLFNSLTNDSIMLKRILFLFSDHATLEVAF